MDPGQESSRDKHDQSEEMSSVAVSVAEEIALISRQVGDLAELVESKDHELDELRGNIRSEKSTFLYLNQRMKQLERQLAEHQQQYRSPRIRPRQGETKSLVQDVEDDIEDEVQGTGKTVENFEEDLVEDDVSESELAMIALDEDTFSFMMTNPVFSRDWGLALTALAFQWSILILIFLNLIQTSEGSSTLNIPYSVPIDVTVGQFLGIFICVGVQTDVLSSVRFVAAIYAEENWASILGFGEEGSRRLFFLHVIVPNSVKFISGCMVLAVNFVTIVQAGNIVDLMKDVAALLIISEITEIFYKLAEFGFLGQKLEDSAKMIPETEVQDPFSSEGFKVNYRLLVFCVLVLAMSGLVANFIVKQQNGTYFYSRYPYCPIKREQIPMIGNGVCDGGVFNLIDCDFDGGDCINYNTEYGSACGAAAPKKLGDGECEQLYNTPQCGFDGGDCCPYVYENGKDERLGDNVCDGGQYSTKKCQFDEGDCTSFTIKYPACNLNKLGEDISIDGLVPRFGNDLCESNVYNIPECGFEDGDCELCNSKVYDLKLTGDGICHGGFHNSPECNFDAGDCTDFNKNYPRCQVEAHSKLVLGMKSVPIIGDGKCNSGLYNNADCGYEDGDCLLCNELVENITKIGDGTCDGQNYMSEACGNDGGDCDGCAAPRYEIGNDWCSPEYNTPECSFDGGDCSFYNLYPDCIVPLPSLLGNGKCDAGVYNTPECEFDGGDCLAIKELTLQNCVVDRAELLGDGTCHGGTYNTPECEFDLGDCTQFNNDYPNCNVPFPELIGNGWCSGGEYDVESCGWDGGDCI